jgi:hypothetical protein
MTNPQHHSSGPFSPDIIAEAMSTALYCTVTHPRSSQFNRTLLLNKRARLCSLKRTTITMIASTCCALLERVCLCVWWIHVEHYISNLYSMSVSLFPCKAREACRPYSILLTKQMTSPQMAKFHLKVFLLIWFPSVFLCISSLEGFMGGKSEQDRFPWPKFCL